MSTITYPPEMLPRAKARDVQLIVVDPISGERRVVWRTPLPNPPPEGGREQAAASGEAAA